uniref:Solute carrier family 16 member 4 n=1 Tax=Apteryx owenii TaxID=8824 RepID=A0A8B9S6C5_APTOW
SRNSGCSTLFPSESFLRVRYKLHPVLGRSFPTAPPLGCSKIIFCLRSGTLLIFGGIMLNLVPSSMLLRPVSSQPPQPSPAQSEEPRKDSETRVGRLDETTSGETQLQNTQDVPTTEGLATARSAGSSVPANTAAAGGLGKETAADAQRGYKYLPQAREESAQPCLDFSPLKDPVFCIFTWSFLFSQLAYFVPTFHLVARARTLGISSMDASYLISVAGITEMVSQLLSGWIADRNWTKKYHYHVTYLVLCGITNLLCPLATTFPLLMAYAVAFAIFCGGFLALVLPVLVDLVGVQKLHSYLGFSAFFAGIAAIGGPPLTGNSCITYSTYPPQTSSPQPVRKRTSGSLSYPHASEEGFSTQVEKNISERVISIHRKYFHL